MGWVWIFSGTTHYCTASIVYIKFCHLINQYRTNHPNQILGCQFKHRIVPILMFSQTTCMFFYERSFIKLKKKALLMNGILRLFLFIFAENEMSETFVLYKNKFSNDYQ